jgi:hypothetical protein
MGSNPTRGMDVCVRLFCVCVVLCVGSGFGWIDRWTGRQTDRQIIVAVQSHLRARVFQGGGSLSVLCVDF